MKVYNHFVVLHFCFGGGLGDPVLSRSHTGTGRQSLLTIFRGQGWFIPISTGSSSRSLQRSSQSQTNLPTECVWLFKGIFGILRLPAGMVSRQVLPVCGTLCFFCPALSTRSRQPIKRYKKLLADIFPRSPVLLLSLSQYTTHFSISRGILGWTYAISASTCVFSSDIETFSCYGRKKNLMTGRLVNYVNMHRKIRFGFPRCRLPEFYFH